MVPWLHATMKPGLHNVNQSARSRATVRMRLHPRTHNVHPQRTRVCTVVGWRRVGGRGAVSGTRGVAETRRYTHPMHVVVPSARSRDRKSVV